MAHQDGAGTAIGLDGGLDGRENRVEGIHFLDRKAERVVRVYAVELEGRLIQFRSPERFDVDSMRLDDVNPAMFVHARNDGGQFE